MNKQNRVQYGFLFNNLLVTMRMKIVKILSLLLIPIGINAQLALQVDAIHAVAGATTATGSIMMSAQGGQAPYTYLCTPGAYTNTVISNLPIGTYSMAVTDANADTARYVCRLGYTVAWDQLHASSLTSDGLQIDSLANLGQAISKNTLAGGIDGWFEYNLKELGQINYFGFIDSLSIDKQNPGDMDYAYYYDGSSGSLYAFLGNAYVLLETGIDREKNLVIGRAGDTVYFEIGQTRVLTYIDAVAAQRAWKIKAFLVNYNGSVIANAGCSFAETGHVFFPGYFSFSPTVMHCSGLGFTDGRISVSARYGSTCTFTWQPGNFNSAVIDGQAPGQYVVLAEDAIGHRSSCSYNLGYKLVWDSLRGTVTRPDTLSTDGPYASGRAVSKNVLEAGIDGWFEYVIDGLSDVKFIGFIDSLAPDPGDVGDLDYGFYCQGNGYLYTIANGNWTLVHSAYTRGMVLRVERKGDTIRMHVNGIVVSETYDAAGAGKAWRVKGTLLSSDAVLANTGCSFYYISPLHAAHSQQDANCILNTNGSITVTPQGGVPPYLVAFGSSAFTNTYVQSNLAAGSYEIKVKDAQNLVDSQVVTILNCPKWQVPYTGVATNAVGDTWKTASDSSWTNAVLTTAEPFRITDTDFWLSFETPDTTSVFMLGFRSQISDSLLMLSDSSLTVSNYRLYVEDGTVTVVETDNDGFYNKFEIGRAGVNSGFKIRLTKAGIEYYQRPDAKSAYALVYVSKLFSPARLIVEHTLFKPGSRTNKVRVSSYGNTY